MPRVKVGTLARKRRKKTLKLAKGYFGSKHVLYKTANEQVMKSLDYAYRDRRQKKRDFRKLWIARINAAARSYGMSYSRMINGLKNAGVQINRKMLADIAVNDTKGFKALVETAQENLGAARPGQITQSKEALEDKTVDELRELCKKQGITGYSSMKKAELIDALSN